MRTEQIQIVHAEHRKLTFKTKSGDNRTLDLVECQCIVALPNRDTGEVRPQVGTFTLFDRVEVPAPGLYTAEFDLTLDKDKRIVARVSNLTAVSAKAMPKAA